MLSFASLAGCFQWFKDTNLKANHNLGIDIILFLLAVFNGSKILIWKQITTKVRNFAIIKSCFQWFKDTNLKANHNIPVDIVSLELAVFNGSKILIWKQITTIQHWCRLVSCCFQWFKDTNLKANHNRYWPPIQRNLAVFNGSKILIWKQITTSPARHVARGKLFSMVQRY